MKPPTATKSYDFTVKLKLSELNQEILDLLYDAGCSDGLVGMKNGEAYIDFTREAPSFLEAVDSAVRDIRKAGFEVSMICASGGDA